MLLGEQLSYVYRRLGSGNTAGGAAVPGWDVTGVVGSAKGSLYVHRHLGGGLGPKGHLWRPHNLPEP